MNRNIVEIDEIAKILRSAKTVAVTGHVNPDGDCIGSITGLGMSLKLMGKDVDMILDDDVPAFLSYIPNIDLIKKPDKTKKYDVFVMVDLGDRKRMGSSAIAMDNSAVCLNFDHHGTNEHICDYHYVETKASSTCEILANFLIDNGFEIDSDVATSLYSGLVTDSNRFLYDTARANAMRTGANLIDLGADVDCIYFNEYQNISANLFAFQGYMVKNALYLNDGKAAIANIRKDILKEYDLTMSEAESCVDVLKNLKGVEVAVAIKEISDKVQKISLRAKSYFDVSEIAVSYGGGGHIKAAGCTLEMTNEEALIEMKKTLEALKLK